MSVAAHLDEFLNCAIGLASVHRSADVRDFLAANGSDEEKKIAATCNEFYVDPQEIEGWSRRSDLEPETCLYEVQHAVDDYGVAVDAI